MEKEHQLHFSFSSFLATVVFLAITGFGFGLPQLAHASDFDSPIQVGADLTSAGANAITGQSTLASQIKGYVLDPLAWFVAKAAIQSIVNSTVNWINSGFHGSPAFATNLSRTLQAVGDTAANNFLSQLASNGSIRSPFQNQVASAVSQNYFSSTGPNGYFNQNPYTLNQVTADDAGFLAGNFSSGGWDAWLSAAMHPANNPYGATILAKNALANQVISAQNNQKTELGWGNGFLSWKGNCSTGGSSALGVSASGGPTIGLPDGTTLNGSAGASTVTVSGPTISPNTQLNTSVPQLGAAAVLALNNPNGPTIGLPDGTTLNGTSNTSNSGGGSGPTIGLPDGTVLNGNNGSSNPNGPTIGLPDGTTLNGNSSQATSLSSNDNCANANIQTPGSVIMAGLNKNLGSGIDTLVNAGQFNEILNALLGQLMNQVLGPTGLGGLSQPSATSNGSTPLNSGSSQTGSSASSLSAGFTQTLASQAASLQTFENEWNIIGAAAQNAKGVLLGSTCSPNASGTVTNTVQPVIDRAISETSQATTALATVTKIQGELSTSTSTDPSAQLTQASTDYSNFISSGQIPSASDMTYAATQSIDTGTSTPPSLYTKMLQLQSAAQSCTTLVPST